MSARWRVALVDSGVDVGVRTAAEVAFTLRDGEVVRAAPRPDSTSHGTRIARVIASSAAGGASIELLSAQVFVSAEPATPAAVAAGIDWGVACGAHLVHLSLGLAADRAVLREAIARALAAGCLVVAATPARGTDSFPAAYPGVIRGTGDARCAAGEISLLDERTFGGCVREGADDVDAGVAHVRGTGASVGTAHVTRALLGAVHPGSTADAACAALAAIARWRGRERRP